MKVPTKNCPKCKGTGRAINSEAIGYNLRKLRLNCNRSLRDIAKAMNITAPYLSDLEKGRREWRPELIDKFVASVTE